jgi:predicted ATPase
MKVKKITLQNYKKFTQPFSISFTDKEGQINEQTLILGNTGAGKSSVLQAIVMLVACATREQFTPESLDWPGYEFRHLQTGRLTLKAEAEITFDDEEIEATIAYAQQLKERGVALGITPSRRKTVTLSLDFYNRKVIANNTSAFFQLSGHQYAKRLATMTPNKTSLFEKVGNIYWYNEQRNSYSFSLIASDKPPIDFIRNFLANAYAYHIDVTQGKREIKEGEFDFYQKLETLYANVFVGRSFVGSAPRFDIYEQSKEPDFFLFDGKNQYELTEMSAGERAVFPILMDFARWNINNSIIIIDEVELHLHPPMQQRLVKVLSHLGKNNQFIFTSHSDSVVSMFNESENQIIRLPNE